MCLLISSSQVRISIAKFFVNSKIVSIFSYCTFIELLFVVFSELFAKQSFASVLKLIIAIYEETDKEKEMNRKNKFIRGYT